MRNIMALLVVAIVGMMGIAFAQPIMLSNINPKDPMFSGKLGIDVIGVGHTSSQLSFLGEGAYGKDVVKLGGQNFVPPTAALIGLMNYDHTKKYPAAYVLPYWQQAAEYINANPAR